MDRVETVAQLSGAQRQQCARFLESNMHVEQLLLTSGFKSATNPAVVPKGAVVFVAADIKLLPSALPKKISSGIALYEIDANRFSELKLLQTLEPKRAEFEKLTGEGPTLDSIHYKNVFSNLVGMEKQPWKPFFEKNKAYISVVRRNDIDQPDRTGQYYLLVSVPNLPVAHNLYREVFNGKPMVEASALADSRLGSIARSLIVQNMDKLADAFATTMNIELLHRKPRLDVEREELLPFASSMAINPGPFFDKERNRVGIGSGIITTQFAGNTFSSFACAAPTPLGLVGMSLQNKAILPFAAPKLVDHILGETISYAQLERVGRSVTDLPKQMKKQRPTDRSMLGHYMTPATEWASTVMSFMA